MASPPGQGPLTAILPFPEKGSHRMSTPPDWQLPPGVNRGLWEYLHDRDLARGYDAGLAGSSLFSLDLAFVTRHCRPPVPD